MTDRACANCGLDDNLAGMSVLCEPCYSYFQVQNYCGLVDRHHCPVEGHHRSGWDMGGTVMVSKEEWDKLQRLLDEPPKVIPGLVKLLKERA